jgi:hypothetical protein
MVGAKRQEVAALTEIVKVSETFGAANFHADDLAMFKPLAGLKASPAP